MRTVIGIVGPTATGKSQLALAVAERLNGQIVSADSRQVYRFMDIGTAKPNLTDRTRVPHHFIDIINPDDPYDVGKYYSEASDLIQNLLNRSISIILCGGSGLYVKALVDGLFVGPAKSDELREYYESLAEEHGKDYLYELLRQIDPDSAKHSDPTKTRRNIRALEVYELTGRRISELQHESTIHPPFDVIQFGIRWETERLNERINRRVDQMLDDGFFEEVRALLAKGYSAKLNSMNTVGYKEGIVYLKGKMSKQECVDEIKKNSRHYAKRQRTWFNADKRIAWLDGTLSIKELTNNIVGYFEK